MQPDYQLCHQIHTVSCVEEFSIFSAGMQNPTRTADAHDVDDNGDNG